jgi:hypothetical protein
MTLALVYWEYPSENLLIYLPYVFFCITFYFLIYTQKNFGLMLVAFSGCLFFWYQQKPKHDRMWIDYQERLPIVNISHSKIHVENLRHDLRYMKKGKLEWLTRSYNLEELTDVRFALVELTEWKGIAHVFLSFNFNDKDFLSVSGEIRREKDEKYSPLNGLFKNYEMMIVLGTEIDLVGVRIFDHKDPINFYPLNISQENSKKLLLNLMKKCQEIQKEPEHYHTFTNNCATLIHDQLYKIYGVDYSYDLRLLFPGYLDEIGVVENLIIKSGSGNVRGSYKINHLVNQNLSGNAWSLKIREKRDIQN